MGKDVGRSWNLSIFNSVLTLVNLVFAMPSCVKLGVRCMNFLVLQNVLDVTLQDVENVKLWALSLLCKGSNSETLRPMLVVLSYRLQACWAEASASAFLQWHDWQRLYLQRDDVSLYDEDFKWSDTAWYTCCSLYFKSLSLSLYNVQPAFWALIFSPWRLFFSHGQKWTAYTRLYIVSCMI